MNIQRHVKQKQVQKLKNKAVVNTFKWRDRKGGYHYPADMETHHLFHTIRMIWNHNMPMKLKPYKKYTFSETYTPQYLEKALRAMVPELAKRSDIENAFRSDLLVMKRWLSTVQIEERKQANKEKSDALMTFK